MADLNDLQRKQADTARLAMKMVDEKDPEKLKEMAEQVKARCDDLQKMAKAIEAAFAPPLAEGPEIRVVLTPEQKARVTEQTGVGIEVVTLHDTKKRVWSHELSIGKVEPREIEKEATREAARLRLISETRTHVEKIVKQLKSFNVPELEDTIRQLEKDPTMGLASKKPK
jgi:hypothetical protein